MNVKDLIDRFSLEPHPEGGYFRETYRSSVSSNYNGFEGARSVSTGIYFLLPEGARSCLHRVKSDEMWHFYLGGPMCLVEIDEAGTFTETIIGSDISAGQLVQYVVPAGVWFGGYPLDGTAYSFVGCTVAPGFDFADFELAQRDDMLSAYPQHEEVIKLLT